MRGLRVETFPVSQIGVVDFASVIEGPAKIAELELGPGLVQAMISDTKTADALPLLAFALRELWEGFGQDKLLTLDEYRDKDKLGGLDGCIARAAEAVLGAKKLSEKEVSDLRTAFLSMVRVNDRDQYAKQPVQWNDLPVSAHEVLKRFVLARLLISSGDEKERTLEVAHEALFRAWPRLATWIGEDREDLFILRRAEIEAGEWERQGYDLKYLWHEDRLKRLQEIVSRRGEKSAKEIVRLFSAPQDKILARLKDSTLSHHDRLTIGQSLATLGDPRPGVRLKEDGLPDIVWIEIPGGEVTLEEVKHAFKVKPFRIAKYLLTNVQFETFIKAEDGYRNEQWWKEIEQSPYTAQRSWQEANAPRETVSWYEAVAFCRWLSAKTRTSIRLPTEWEWQQAATGGNPDREYPWEGGWDDSRCNSWASRLNRTTVVGMYPSGATQQGVLDMAGNVREWCLNTYEQPSTTIKTGGGRVFRGGAWNGLPKHLRSSYRHSYHADSRSFDLGFRLAQDLP